MAQFGSWFEEWTSCEPIEPSAVVLATAGLDGAPAARYVLLRGLDHGFCFFTNYRSRKGLELAADRRAALCFGWLELARQVRVEGSVELVAEAESDAYFANRPRPSQIGAWASEQSEVLADRAVLEARTAEVAARFEGADVERPPHWGGYRLLPDRFEFWQGRENRQHDRFRYRRSEADAWVIERLAP
jgi:pyridoxamine 5'-phosphate oxidase